MTNPQRDSNPTGPAKTARKIRHLDLFSGIGGFAYAVESVWGEAEHIFCDNDKFCQEVLSKHWPEAKQYGDISSITDTERKGWWQRPIAQERPITRPDNRPDLLTGGFPCQPFSAAGVRRGTADERYLWPEMLRVIQLTKPTWVIAENVRGLLTWEQGVVFEQVCLDLENEGYEVQSFIIPALAVNAPHRRDRIWWVAFNPEYAGRDSTENRESIAQRGDSNSKGSDKSQQLKRPDSLRQTATNPRHQRQTEPEKQTARSQQYSWQRHWLEVATELCSLDDGLPVELDGFKLSAPRSRKEQLKAYGNAIVPQVAIEIFKAIKEANP